MLGDGVATMLAGLIGGPANTTYSENTGVLAVTGVYDPAILRIGATFAMVLGFVPWFPLASWMDLVMVLGLCWRTPGIAFLKRGRPTSPWDILSL